MAQNFLSWGYRKRRWPKLEPARICFLGTIHPYPHHIVAPPRLSLSQSRAFSCPRRLPYINCDTTYSSPFHCVDRPLLFLSSLLHATRRAHPPVPCCTPWYPPLPPWWLDWFDQLTSTPVRLLRRCCRGKAWRTDGACLRGDGVGVG